MSGGSGKTAALETWDTILGVVQKLAVICGIGIGAVFFFMRLEHTPSLDTELRFVGISDCTAKGELTLTNIGTWPFELTDAYIAARPDPNDAVRLESALNQTLAAKESVSILFDLPLEPAMLTGWVPVKLSLITDKDEENQWRLTNQWVDFGTLGGSC
ncbi:hypothetical protein [Salipiger abyssi]|uniref:hypothetical protein n=1 Tax=Salipiger abyssi TaxID=1250539 RepID=UPI00405A3322